MKKQLTMRMCMLLFALMFSLGTMAQLASNYSFFSTSSATIADMSSGTTQLIGSGSDDGVSALTDIGFTFIFRSIQYTQFSVNANGLLKLGSPVITGAYGNDLTNTTNMPQIAPYWDDLHTGTNGKVHYKVAGSAPNRILIVEWLVTVPRNTSGPANGRFQCWLWEGSGRIDFVYDAMRVNSANSGYSIGFAWYNTQFASITAATNTCSYVTANNTQTDTIYANTGYWFNTPAAPANPTNLTFSAVTGTSMTLNWTDNATNEVEYLIYKSTDGINYTYVASPPADATSYNATGLSFGTTYYWRVYAINEGKISSALEGSQATNAGTISGNKTIGPTGDYASLTAAFNDINTNGLAASVNLILQSDYVSTVETFPIVPSNSMVTTPTRTITIYPAASGLSITSANTTATFNFNGSDYIIIDGRVNASGSTANLVIENTSASGSAIQFIEDACDNVIKYSKIKGLYYNTTASKGVINFSTSTLSTGNDNNTITYCDIYSESTYSNCLIYSSGSAGRFNNNITISNNNIYDFRASAASAYGIYFTNYTSDCSISGNSFYQTTTTTITAVGVYPIYISSSGATMGSNFNVSNNYIGGTAPLCGGTALTYGTGGVLFLGIYISEGIENTNNITGNTIKNLDITTSATSSVQGCIRANNGKTNIANNIIGSDTEANSIRITMSGSSTSLFFAGIITGNGTTGNDVINITGNKIGGITHAISGTPTNHGHFRAMSIGSGGPTANTAVTIENNLIGSTTIANSITSNSNSALYAIYENAGGSATYTNRPVTISNNTICNVSNTHASGTNATVYGIYSVGSTYGAHNINTNLINNLSSTSGGNIVGIYASASSDPNQVITGNTICNLNHTNATLGVTVMGIQYSGPTLGNNIIEKNKIYNLNAATSNSLAIITGIHISNGTTTIKNNMIALGHNVANGIEIRGIYQFLGSGIKFYHNSVYIGGTAASGAANSYAFFRAQTTSACDIFNNIFVNERTGSTGKDHALRINSFTDTTYLYCDNNILKTANTANLAAVGTISLTFPMWQNLSVGNKFDVNGYEADPQFFAPNAATPDLHIKSTVPTYVEGRGILIPTVTDDFDGDTRADFTPVDIGADADYFTPVVITNYDIAAIGMTAPTTPLCPANNQTVTVTIKNLSSTTIDFATKNVTVGVNVSGASTQNFSTVINTGTLAVNDTLDVNVTSSCDLTSAGPHNFSCYALIAGDVNTANDTLSNKIIIVNPLPLAVTSLSVDNDTICSNAVGTITLTANGGSGTTLNWFTGSCGGTNIGSGTPFSIPAPTATTKYYVRWETTSCGVSDCDSIIVTVLPLPSATATPTGPTILPVNSTNTDYTITGVANATAYEWLLSPAGAGTISGTGLTGTVDWNNTYSGQAEISVVAWNNNCPGDTSDVLTVTLTSPVMTTLAATNITSNAATLNGSINPNDLIVRDIVFQYGLTTSYTHSIAPTIDTATGTMVINFSADATGLTPNTTYHYRIYGHTNSIVFTGADETFTTSISVPQFDVTFNVSDGTNPINGATVTLTGYGTQTTNASGIAIFNNVDSNTITGYDWTVAATGYTTQTGNVMVAGNEIVNVTMPLITYTVTFNVTDGTNPISGATINLTGYTSQTTNASGVAVFPNVIPTPAPGIAWEVIKTGYNTINGNVIVDSNEIVNVVLNLTTYTVTFNVTDGSNPINSATVTLAGYGTQNTNSAGVAIFTNVVPAASIAWTVEKTGYTTQSGNVNVSGNQTVNVTMPVATYTVTFNISDGVNPVNAAIVTLTGYGTQTTNSSGVATFTSVAVTPAPGIAYSVTKTGFNTSTGNVIVDGNETVNITLTHSYYDVIFHVFDNITNAPWNNIPVVVIGQSTVNTNSNGIAAFSLIMGNYNYEVRFTTDTIEGNFTVPVSDTIEVPYHVGIAELGNIHFGMYPNPAKERINIIANETIETIKLIDITGTVVSIFNVNSKNTNLELTSLPEGNYIVLVETSKGKGMRKLQIIK